ncbi:MAG: RNA-binding transcriptional accessory protein [Candidatus Omnitrophica bacterium]|nr:RNA-binding transcriptional accessory protein [Candidatus Omnitrophota bacterium]
MEKNYTKKIAEEYKIKGSQVNNTLKLLDDGSTVPFISRYRKEMTGNLDEIMVMNIRDRITILREIDKRRDTVLKTIHQQGKLTDELKAKIIAAETMQVLEDLYLPYKPKKRTKATVAREKGLEPLAKVVWDQNDIDVSAEAEKYLTKPEDIEKIMAEVEDKKDIKKVEQKIVKTVAEALEGARHIMAEWINEDSEARSRLRVIFQEKGIISSKVNKSKQEEALNYKDYYAWSELARTAPSHRILAVRRGEKEKFLAIRITVDDDEAVKILTGMFVTGKGEDSQQVVMALEDSYKRLLSLSLETEFKVELKKRADQDAIEIFANNLRQLLMASPLGQKRVMAIDPGYRTGCKVVCLDAQGQFLCNDAIYLVDTATKAEKAKKKIKDLCDKHDIEVIAIGNGTASRETDAFIRKIGLPEEISIVMVNESGASIYSASEVARNEFPDFDVTVRGSISIGRRLQDPLAELVKIESKNIGVGQYQHDVDQKLLRRCLDDVVVSCVNQVGVELNTASKELLTYVSGIGPARAQAIIDFRNQNGPFSSRQDLTDVSGMSGKFFEQAAGFLRIYNAANPLDASAVHPESYAVVCQMASDAECTIQDLMSNEQFRNKVELNAYISDSIGLPTLIDIKDELAKPGRDPREPFQLFTYKEGIEKIEDLEPGMKLPGVITNITAFGAFCDIGVHHDGLIHISQLSDRYIKNPHDLVKVHQKVEVTVIDIDMQRKRIALTMKKDLST